MKARVGQVSTYDAVYERDETGWWHVRVPSVRGCLTQGRTVEEARRRIREALGLFVDDARTATLKDDIKLPARARRAIYQFTQHRRLAAREETKAANAARSVVKMLGGGSLKMSTRDTAELLGISHQRVHQLVRARVRRKARRR
jgi:predicted RNase H-like HicB family nuclease